MGFFKHITEQIKAAVDTGNIETVERVLSKLKCENDLSDSWFNVIAFQYAIDIGAIEITKHLNESYYVKNDYYDGNWSSINRSAHKNHLDLVKYFMDIRNPSQRFYMWADIASSGARNNNIEMIKYGLDGALSKYSTRAEKNAALYNILMDRSGPITCACADGSIEAVKYLVSILKSSISKQSKETLFDQVNLNMTGPFYYGRNQAAAQGNVKMVKFLENLHLDLERKAQKASNMFFSRSTRMQVAGPHLTDEAMAEFYVNNTKAIMGSGMRRMTLYKDQTGKVHSVHEFTINESVKRAILALSIFRGDYYRDFSSIPNSKVIELGEAVMASDSDNKLWWTNFCVNDILTADTKKLQAFQMIYKEIMGKTSETATGKDMLDATFPDGGRCGVPWGHDIGTILDRFPSVSQILISRGPGW